MDVVENMLGMNGPDKMDRIALNKYGKYFSQLTKRQQDEVMNIAEIWKMGG
jgi:hypothetical protein